MNKNIDGFFSDKSRLSCLSTYCKSCHRERKSEYRERTIEERKKKEAEWYQRRSEYKKGYKRLFYGKNKEKIQSRRRELKYGVDNDGVRALLEVQGEKCGICKKSIGMDACVDHDHETREIRGLLCKGCNLAIGCFKDNKLLVMSAYTYLNSPPARNQSNGSEFERVD